MAGVRKTSLTNPSSGVVYEMTRLRADAPEASPSPRTDSSGITSAARELSSGLLAVEASDDVRTERVRALRKQISAGTYNPDPREIAIKLLGHGF